jgi:hypothetical protein
LLSKEGVWQELLNNKYLRGKTLLQVQAKPTDSPFWKCLMGVKDDCFQRGSFALGDGNGTRFWEDAWLGESPLASQYSTLYNIIRTKNVLVADVLSQVPLNTRLNGHLIGDKWDAWIYLVLRVMNVHLNNEPYNFKWRLTSSGVFLV